MAATGPRNLRLAGRLADIAMLQVGFNPASVTWAVEQVYRGAEEAGRNPDEIEIVLMGGMWVSDDLEEAREQSRWAAACAANHLGDVMQRVPDHGMPDELTRLVEARTLAYDYYEGHLDSSAEHTGWLTDELIDDFAINGPAEQCLERIRALPSWASTRSPAPTSTVRSTSCSGSDARSSLPWPRRRHEAHRRRRRRDVHRPRPRRPGNGARHRRQGALDAGRPGAGRRRGCSRH